MKNRISYSAISTFSECGEKYFLRYKKKMRSKYFHAALGFGSAADAGLNTLLKTRDVPKAKAEFEKTWNFQLVNKVYTSLSKDESLVYAETDFDAELLTEEDEVKLETEALAFGEFGWKPTFETILKEKKERGWKNVAKERKQFYNYCNWLSMRQKGLVIIDSYNKYIMPQIKKVLAVQHENSLKNSEGDEVIQYLDLIVEWKDGKNILFDNKTSARDYEADQASYSSQLISYYHGAKEQFKLDAVGFLVIKKQMIKNRVKICSVCSFDGSGSRHKTCNSDKQGERCNGAWNESISPEAWIDVIINQVTPAAENLVLAAFDESNEGMKAGVFKKNLGACVKGKIRCEFFDHCWAGDDSDLIVVEDKKVEKA